MNAIKSIGLVAHDHFKQDMVEWVAFNFQKLQPHQLISTGTTGRLVEESIIKKMGEHKLNLPLSIKKLSSGPLGGDQQLGALITEGRVDMLIFFWDPMQPQPHDVDVKALLRLAVLYNIPTASNRSTADFLISSPLFDNGYTRQERDYSTYIKRSIP